MKEPRKHLLWLQLGKTYIFETQIPNQVGRYFRHIKGYTMLAETRPSAK